MLVSVIVVGLILLGTVVALVVVRQRLAVSRRRSREFDAADLASLSNYATSHGLTVVQADDKSTFLATGELQGLQVSLSTAHLEFVLRGRTVVGPIETHLRVRGLPSDARALTARPLTATAGNTQVENPLTRGVDLLPTGDDAFDDGFRTYATTAEELNRWLDPSSRERLVAVPQVREVRLSDGELSISLVPQGYVGGEQDDTPWNHVHPVMSDAKILDTAARILARIHANTTA